MKDLLDSFIERYYDNVLKMEIYNSLVAEILEVAKHHDPDAYKHFHEEIENMMNSVYYEMVETVLDHITNSDGTKGPKWSYDDVRKVVEDHRVKDHIEDLNCLVFWYVMNKEYATHSRKVRDLSYYIETAVEEIQYYGDEKFEHEIKDRFEKGW